jgi:hypothetical protein
LVVAAVSALATFFCIFLSGAALLLQTTPLVRPDRAINELDFQQAERLLRRAQYALGDSGSSATVSATQHDLDSLATFAARSVDGLAGAVEVTPAAIRFKGSYDVGRNPIGRYLNITLTVHPAASGLDIAGVNLGHVRLGPRLGRAVIDFAMARVLGAKLSRELLRSVDEIAISTNIVSLTLTPNATVEEGLKERVVGAVAETSPSTVGAYYREIMKIASTYDHIRPVPFVDFLQPLLVMAKERSQKSDPVNEMRGVILAFAVYIGGKRVEDIRKNVLPPDLARLRRPYAKYIVLRGHPDHLQHFFVSAALTLSGGAAFTTVIGEAKELDDLRRGGEDFSLQDLAADRAGIVFARRAETSSGARYLESLGEQPRSEELFFPDVSDLPDSMSPARFNALYGDIDSPAFKAVLADIDRRIQSCKAYQPTN